MGVYLGIMKAALNDTINSLQIEHPLIVTGNAPLIQARLADMYNCTLMQACCRALSEISR